MSSSFAEPSTWIPPGQHLISIAILSTSLSLSSLYVSSAAGRTLSLGDVCWRASGCYR